MKPVPPPIRIDLAPRSAWRTALTLSPLAALAGLLGLGLCLTAAIEIQGSRQRQQALQARIDALQAGRAQTLPRVAPRAAVPPARAAAVNAAIAQLNLPWSAMLDGFERASSRSVALLALTPDPSGRQVRGSAEARNPAAMLAYIDRLNAQAVFEDARLLRHETSAQDANKPLAFDFEVRWREVAP